MSAQPGRRVRVLHLITRLVPGGAQDNTLVTCELHDRARYEVHVAGNPDGSLVERARAASDGRFHPIPDLVHPLDPLRDARALWQILRLLRRERFDLVHGHSSKAGFLGRIAARLTRTPFVFTYHGFPFHDFMPRWKQAFYVGLERMVRGAARHYITLSERDRQTALALRMVPEGASSAIYTGIDFAKIDRVLAAPPPDPLAALGVPANGRRIVLVGRLDPQKAPLRMVEAFAQVRRELPDAQLVFVGDGELRQAVADAARGAGLHEAVHLLGYRKDVIEILVHCDVFAFSSSWEAMGRSMLEAMLVARPVVAPAIYGIPEVVEDGVTGWLYPLGDTARLAGCVVEVLSDPARARGVGQAAQQRIRAQFDARLMVRRIEEIYGRVLGDGA